MGPRHDRSQTTGTRIPKDAPKSSALAQAGQQLFVDAVELAVGEDRNHITVEEVRDEAVDNRVGIGRILGHLAVTAQPRDDRVGIQALVLLEFLQAVYA